MGNKIGAHMGPHVVIELTGGSEYQLRKSSLATLNNDSDVHILMGRTKGTKNRVGHRAGGARKGAGRKPRVSEEHPPEQTISKSRIDEFTDTESPKHHIILPIIDQHTACVSPILTPSVDVQQLPTPLSLYSQPLPSQDTSDGQFIHQNLSSLTAVNPNVGHTKGQNEAASSLISSQPILESTQEYYEYNASSLQLSPHETVMSSNTISNSSTYISPSLYISNGRSPSYPEQMTIPSSGCFLTTPLPHPWSIQSTSSELSKALIFPSSTPSAIPNTTLCQREMIYSNTEYTPLSPVQLPSPSPSISSTPPEFSPKSHVPGPPWVHIAPAPCPQPIREQQTWNFPYPLPAAVGDPDQPYAILANVIHKRRRRRCLVCVQLGMERNSYECPGRGNRSKCPSFCRYGLLESPKKTQGARISYNQNPNAAPLLADDQHQIGSGCANPKADQVRVPISYATFENVKKRSKRCMICVGNGKDGTICSGRGNRTLCPDYFLM